MIKTSFFFFLITFSLEASALPRFVVERGMTCFIMAKFKGCWDTEPANDPAVPGQVCYKDDKTGKILVAKDKCDSESSLVTQYECAELADKSGKKINHISPVSPQECKIGCDEKTGACLKAECVDHDVTEPDPLLKPSFVEVFYPGMPSQTYGDGCLKKAPTMVNEMVCNSDKSGFMSTGQPCPAGFHCQMDGQGYGYCVPPWCTDLNPSDPSKPFDSSNSAGIQAGWGNAPPTTTPNTCLKDFPLPFPLDPDLAAQPDKILLDMTCLDLNKDGKYGEGDIPWLPTAFVCPGVCLQGQGKCSNEPTVDECKVMSDPAKFDPDNDGLGYKCDNCLTVPNPDQKDSDTDGLGDACDLCPSDATKTTSVGVCGCSQSDVDTDQDGQPDCQDNCPLVANTDQLDSDGDKVGDACDNCPMVSNLAPDQCSGGWKQVSAGFDHACGVAIDGKVVCWGNNSVGQSSPPAGSFAQVSVGHGGGSYACGVKTNGEVVCWGNNDADQSNPSGGLFTQVSAGAYHVCGVKTDGKVICWGDNSAGQSSPPAGIFTQVSAGYSYTGDSYTCGVKTDGKVVCWGSNSYGKSNPPAGIFTQVGAGADHTCGLKADGKVICWGSNALGQLLNTPVENLAQISVGWKHACGVKSDGQVVCWGNKYSIGSGPPTETFIQIGAGVAYTCGVKTDGQVVCWQGNSTGQPGSPPALNSVCPSDFVPTQTDSDGDKVGDACDNCPTTANADQGDFDGDKAGNTCDLCPNDPAKIISTGVCGCGVPDVDSNGDGKLDCQKDNCLSDPNKSEPGICGCGNPETDTDQDGQPDCKDGCPSDPKKVVGGGACGCGVPDVDSDKDGKLDCQDNCPLGANADQLDSDGDKVGDVCDNCPLTMNSNQGDDDNDGVGNVCDNCQGGSGGNSCISKAKSITICGKMGWALGMGMKPGSNSCAAGNNQCLYADEGEYFVLKISNATLFTFSSVEAPPKPADNLKLETSKPVTACTPDPSQKKEYSNSMFEFWNTVNFQEDVYVTEGACPSQNKIKHLWLNPEEFDRLVVRVAATNGMTPPPKEDPAQVQCSGP